MTDLPPPPPPGPYGAPPPPPGGWAQPPPGPYGYPAVPSVARTHRLAGLATALTILLAIITLVDLAGAAALFDRAGLIDDPAASFGDLVDADDRVGGTVGLHTVGFVVIGILWIIWQWRLVKNVEARGRPTGFGAGFAIGGWAIPFANWFIPERQLAVSAKSSSPTASTPGVLYAWWASFAVSTLLVAVAQATRPADDELGSFDAVRDFQSADRIHAVGLLISAAAAVLGLLTVRTCTRHHEQTLGASQF